MDRNENQPTFHVTEFRDRAVVLTESLQTSVVSRLKSQGIRQVPGYKLWVGNAGDLRDVRKVMSLGIEAVVELADSEQLATLPRDLIRCRFPISDGGDNAPWLLRFAVDTVAGLLRPGVPVLVCCSAGMSRSLCIAAAALAVLEDKSLLESLKAVTVSGPADVSPGLFIQLQQVLGEEIVS